MKKLVTFSFLILFSFLAISLVFAEDTATTTTSSEQNIEQTPSVTEVQTPAPVETQTTTATSEETPTSETTPSSATDSATDKSQEAEFDVKPGITPDNPVYIIKDTYQRIVVGNDPEKALDYREQKIAEAKVMIEEGKTDEANKVLDRALQYGDIVQKEANPDSKAEIQERSEIVQNVMEDLKNQTDNQKTKDKFDENLDKEKDIENAVELVAKINELCQALAKLDPLQYSDTCKPKDNSPKWMKEQNKELTAEQQSQARIFFEKLSQCYENPNDCDCKGMGVQSFEDFCNEKSTLAKKCERGDKDACKSMESGSDATDLLPDYLISTFKQVESKYSKSQFDNFAPEECTKAGAKTPEACNKIMFKQDSPKECIDAGLTGESKEDEIKCKEIMFKKDPPKECTDAGIDKNDKDGPRKCSKIMFAKYSAQECIDAGITGEGRDDQKKCNELLNKAGNNKENNTYAPKFNRDCKAIQDTAEKMKCYEEFYNNAQVQIKDDFRQREMIDSNNGEVITAEEEKQRQICRDKGMGTILEYENGKRIVICVDKNMENQQGQSGTTCQSQQQTENLKQDCKTRGQDSRVEMRGGCPWVMCISTSVSGGEGGSSTNYVRIDTNNQQTSGGSGGQKCPDGTCDDYERMNPYACPEDCGGTRQPGNNPQQQPGDYQPPQNEIDQPQQNQVCSSQTPSCPDATPYCQNGNWVCPSAPPQEQQQPTQPIEQQPPLPPNQIQTPAPEVTPAPSPTPTPEATPTPEPEPSPAPVTGGVISVDSSQQPADSLNNFLTYWWN